MNKYPMQAEHETENKRDGCAFLPIHSILKASLRHYNRYILEQMMYPK